MYSFNYKQCLLNNIWEWHPSPTKFADSTNFIFSVYIICLSEWKSQKQKTKSKKYEQTQISNKPKNREVS